MSPASGSFGRLLRSELRLLLGRRRTLALLAGLGAVPLLLALVLVIAQGSGMAGQGPGFIGRVTGNGLFLVIAALFLSSWGLFSGTRRKVRLPADIQPSD